VLNKVKIISAEEFNFFFHSVNSLQNNSYLVLATYHFMYIRTIYVQI